MVVCNGDSGFDEDQSSDSEESAVVDPKFFFVTESSTRVGASKFIKIRKCPLTIAICTRIELENSSFEVIVTLWAAILGKLLPSIFCVDIKIANGVVLLFNIVSDRARVEKILKLVKVTV